MLAGQPVGFARAGEDEIVWWVEVASCGEDAKSSECLLDGSGGGKEVVAAGYGKAGQDTQLGQVRCDPVDQGQETGSEES